MVDRIVWGDEPFYLWLGRNWLTGQGYTFTGYHDVHHSPLFPLLSGILYLVTGNLQVASNIIYVILVHYWWYPSTSSATRCMAAAPRLSPLSS